MYPLTGIYIDDDSWYTPHCNIGIWENRVLRGTGPIFASGNSLVSIWSFLLGLLLRIAVHHYDLSRWNLYFGQNYFLVSITLGVLIHQLPFRGYYWPRNTHLDILDELPWEMQTQNFWKKSLGTNFFYFSNSSKKAKLVLFTSFFHWSPWKKIIQSSKCHSVHTIHFWKINFLNCTHENCPLLW